METKHFNDLRAMAVPRFIHLIQIKRIFTNPMRKVELILSKYFIGQLFFLLFPFFAVGQVSKLDSKDFFYPLIPNQTITQKFKVSSAKSSFIKYDQMSFDTSNGEKLLTTKIYSKDNKLLHVIVEKIKKKGLVVYKKTNFEYEDSTTSVIEVKFQKKFTYPFKKLRKHSVWNRTCRSSWDNVIKDKSKFSFKKFETIFLEDVHYDVLVFEREYKKKWKKDYLKDIETGVIQLYYARNIGLVKFVFYEDGEKFTGELQRE